MFENSSRLLVLVALVLSLVGGCARCGQEGSGRGTSSPEAAADAALGIAELVPADVTGFVALRDLSAVSTQYRALRPRIDALIGNVGMVETDLRNTIGVDPARLEDLTPIGVDAGGGIGLALVGASPVIVVRLADTATFVTHMTRTGQGQPFNLSAPVEEVEVGDARLFRLRRAPEGNAKISFAVRGRVGYIFGDASGDRALLERLLAVEPTASLATEPRWSGSAARFDGAAIVLYVNPATAADVALGSGAPLDAEATDLIRRLSRGQTFAAGITLSADRIEVDLAQAPSPDLVGPLTAAVNTAGTNPDFARLVGPDAYLVARATLAPAELLNAVRAALSAPQQAQVDAMFASIRETSGLDFEAEILPTLGRNVLVMATRARMLTLRRVVQASRPNPGETATAFGIVIALEVSNRAAVSALLDRVATTLGARAERFESNGSSVLGFTDQQADIGNIVLTDRFLILVPQRNRDELLEQLQRPATQQQQLRSLDARALVNDVSANGIFVDLQAIATGPIGSTLGPMLPDEVMRAAANFDSLLVRTEFVEGELRTHAVVQFTTEPAGTTAGSGTAP